MPANCSYPGRFLGWRDSGPRGRPLNARKPPSRVFLNPRGGMAAAGPAQDLPEQTGAPVRDLLGIHVPVGLRHGAGHRARSKGALRQVLGDSGSDDLFTAQRIDR